ncbi:uncharacterized protein TrAtP1_003038 [Trichoderma atroviride]|uniref:uncharacterized protein n=1 Tax=Hypocrea atroviridis TaxID=63577 RepID=UPI0033250CA6|nr:hypothetical protein TrAtP1_003038 [Trichoderma atroviride]
MASYQSLQRKGSAAKRSTEIRVEGDAPRLGLSLAPKCHLKTGAAGGQLKGPNELKRPSPAGEAPDGHAQMRSLLLAGELFLLILRYTAACGMPSWLAWVGSSRYKPLAYAPLSGSVDGIDLIKGSKGRAWYNSTPAYRKRGKQTLGFTTYLCPVL